MLDAKGDTTINTPSAACNAHRRVGFTDEGFQTQVM